MAENLIEKISLEDKAEEIGTEKEENENAGKNEQDFIENKQQLPSKITDVNYICMPPLPDGYEDSLEWKSSGKWLLYAFDDQKKLDMMWSKLQPLVVDGILSRLKASTATNPLDAIIMCYTSNCKDKNAVKKAADAIRNVTVYDLIMYYKTNESSESGLYTMHGDRYITKYMHTVAQSLYERNENGRWIKVLP